MIRFICSTMMSLLRFTILFIFGVVTSQNHDVNSKIPYGGSPTQSSGESMTLILPDSTVKNDVIQVLLTRLEAVCVKKLEFLIMDTNNRFQSLENHFSEVYSSVNNIREEHDRIDDPWENLLVEKLDNLTTAVGELSQCCSVPATPVIQNNEILEAKVENLSTDIPALMEATTNLPSDMKAIEKIVSSPINVTRLLEGLSSNSKLEKISNLQEMKDLQTAPSTSYPLNTILDKKYPRNCREVEEFEKTASGNYMIQPEHASKPFEAVCELETRGGGWTVIQRRFDGSQDFYLGWKDYKNGFGNLGGEFWLGLENIHLLTEFEENELLIETGDFDSQDKSELYSMFSVGSEMEGYSLKVLGASSGSAGDSLKYQVGSKFSTKDNDQDGYMEIHCAHDHGGAWWYNGNAHSNLNGQYHGGSGNNYTHYDNFDGVFWYSHMQYESLKHTRMLVRSKGVM